MKKMIVQPSARWWRSGLLLAVVVAVLAVVEIPTHRMLRTLPALAASPIQKMDEALAQKKVNAAVRAWDEAYRAAVPSGRWEDLVAVADGYRRVGEVGGRQGAFDAKAREIYLSALFRAREQDSLDGVLSAGQGLAALGDRQGVEQSLRIAELMTAGDPEAQADLRAFTERFADQLAPLSSRPARAPVERGAPYSLCPAQQSAGERRS